MADVWTEHSEDTNNPNYKSSPKAQPPQRKWVYKGMGSSLEDHRRLLMKMVMSILNQKDPFTKLMPMVI